MTGVVLDFEWGEILFKSGVAFKRIRYLRFKRFLQASVCIILLTISRMNQKLYNQPSVNKPYSLTISLSCPQCNVLQRAAIRSGPYNILLKPMIHELIRTDGKKRWQDSNDTIQLSVLRVSDFFLHSSFLSGFLLQVHIYVMNQRYLQYSKLLLANGELEVTVILW